MGRPVHCICICVKIKDYVKMEFVLKYIHCTVQNGIGAFIVLFALLSQFNFIVYSQLALLQLVNDGPVSTFITRDVSKFIVRKFFREGDMENDMICELCPNGKVIRKQPNSPTWNLLRHMKRKHASELRRSNEERLLGEI